MTVIGTLNSAPHSTGIIFYGRNNKKRTYLSYKKIAREASSYAKHFKSIGVSNQSQIIFPFETNEKTITSFFAIISIGAIPLVIKTPETGTSWDSYYQFLQRLSSKYNVDKILESPCLIGKNLDLQRIKIPELDTLPADSKLEQEYSSNQTLFVQFSSGSTSFPKGIPITKDKLEKQLQLIYDFVKPEYEDKVVSWLPLYHDMGLVGCFLAGIKCGISLHLSTPMQFILNPINWLKYISENRITITAIPDFAIQQILRACSGSNSHNINTLDLGCLRTLFVGSEPINAEKLEQFIHIFSQRRLNPSSVTPCYGMAEAVLMVSCNDHSKPPRVRHHPNQKHNKIVSSGKLTKDFQALIRSDTGKICKEEEIGEIELRRGTLVDNYYLETDSFYNNEGFFPTGDLGFLKDGELFITGRKGDRVKINGQSLFLNDVDRIIESLSLTKTGKVATLEASGQLVILIELSTTTARSKMENWRKLVQETIAKQLGIKLPSNVIRFIKRGYIKRTSSGKLKRNETYKLYASGLIQELE
jgi:acyl-CoA synthetase (AMP-forming)/AMP-acid ligase II